MSEQYVPPRESTRAASDGADESLGQIVSEIAGDMSTLVRQEIALAKAEVTEDAKRAGKAGGMFAGAGLAGWMLVLFASMAAMWALGEVMALGWAALIVAAIWAVIAAVLAMRGRQEMRQVSPKPERTVETLKEDVQWAKSRSS